MTPQLDGQTVVVIGGSAGIGLATARAAREEGTEVILAARKRERLDRPRRRSARAARPPSTRSTRLRSTGSSRPP
jgi:NAD(P)-dependent dehydrogenase (short-subunit alcohol dehydrogenase family)